MEQIEVSENEWMQRKRHKNLPDFLAVQKFLGGSGWATAEESETTCLAGTCWHLDKKRIKTKSTWWVSVSSERTENAVSFSVRRILMMDWLTLYVEVLSFVHQRHHLLRFGGHSLEPSQPPHLPFGLLGSRVGQQVVQVLGKVVSLCRGGQNDRQWIKTMEKGRLDRLKGLLSLKSHYPQGCTHLYFEHRSLKMSEHAGIWTQ